MNPAITSLIGSMRALRSKSNLTIQSEGETAFPEGESEDEKAQMFQDLYGYSCPDSLKPALLFPDEFNVAWRKDDRIAGEFSFANLFLTPHRKLDPSFDTFETKGFLLSEMRIMDAVVLHGGPIYTLVPFKNEQFSEELHLFDTRKADRLSINFTEYLKLVALTKGIVYWQFLFSETLRPTGLERALLQEGIAFLTKEFPAANDYEALSNRLQKET